MITKTLEQVANMTNAELSIPTSSQDKIKGVSINTRTIETGQLFVPLAGENVDGHKFVEQAFEKGASAAFWKRNMPNPPEGLPLLLVDDPLEALQRLAKAYRDSLKVKVVGVTGSNGKTTTKDMIAQILSGTYTVQKTIGNYNNHIGLPLTLLSLREDTEVIVLEMGMSARGEIEFLSELARPDVAVITNIGEAHLEDLGSREGIAEAKFEIIAGLSANGLFVYDGDEPLLQAKVGSKSWQFHTISFGKSDQCDYYPISVEAKGEGTEFIVQAFPETKMYLPVLGLHNVKNALAAIAVARFLQVDQETIKNQLECLSLSAMRMESHKGFNGALIINDAYNASPTSMKAAIELVQSLENYSKKVLVLGDMLELGPSEKELHSEIGHFISANDIQYVYTYGPLASYIASGIREKGKSIAVKEFSNKDELRHAVKALLDEQTVLLVKASRGMKLEEVLEGLI
ncbi:UDP-N-acetylmuramoyl-tripeptide--D-alanyl-D-alanine ligase [Bacillus litorisediminis]|uniref:UDP-N-acetylmuramoyl-tripeptide--D-alanyl-D- alanine ligase n=1 Tax=Bacillus litorisediminis TaxID=2922713 RepID=UPI001FADDA47|nr:UDP-N-acetylmuramoyl-tripeptide--D-alanyl-D-alanine ligase [Bacillus litorisediminis]